MGGQKKKVAVIGGGPAGMEAALTAARYDCEVTLITDSHPGDWKMAGTAAWLQAIASLSPYAGIEALSPRRINEAAQDVIRQCAASAAEQLRAAGVSVQYGRARFQSAQVLTVAQEQGESVDIHADLIFIANGARPHFPEAMRPDGRHIYSYTTLTDMERLPASVIVVGDGPIGYEAVNLFSRFGVQVDWLVEANGPRCFFDPDIDAWLTGLFQRRHVNIRPGERVKAIHRQDRRVTAIREDGAEQEAEASFVTLGFRPNVDQLNIEAAGLALNGYGSVDCNPFGQTAIPSIYIAGDAQRTMAGVYSIAMARAAALHAVGRTPEPVDVQTIPFAFNDAPEVATVGLPDAGAPGIHSRVVNYNAERNGTAILQGETEGFLKLLWNDEGRIVGGTAIGLQAKHIISTVAMMIRFKLGIGDCQLLMGAHPSVSELLVHTLHAIHDQHAGGES
ncbi:NAD(P)/FAD-dependent oxidoreductase [Paenibacillus thiaminolyticus]|nr:NAD(P)/FAD-dependent oxidoreductase [Paenibacillus thiaminolyticus]